ncbi:hypothetical protein J7369_14410, partial [Xanthomonas phaseoli pv. dieffenbachiae]|uniref:hypothetical protein n=1 Tax=Xanthomonas phaseoli TaxID=1985254 RepID=UPI001ADAA8A6
RCGSAGDSVDLVQRLQAAAARPAAQQLLARESGQRTARAREAAAVWSKDLLGESNRSQYLLRQKRRGYPRLFL